MIGGKGNDKLYGGDSGSHDDGDYLAGGVGDDRLEGGINGSGTGDEAHYDTAGAAINANMETGTVTGEGTDTLLGIQLVFGTRYADTLTSDASGGVWGLGGNDTIHGSGNGGDGDDTFWGSNRFDSQTGGLGSDTLRGADGADYLDAIDSVEGNDSIDGGLDSDECSADPNDTLTNCP